jgi:glycosyltransferase involved in cell wall biosynthesis
VPEIVVDGVNGFVCADVAAAVGAVSRIATLDRARVRANCDERFSDRVLVDRMLAIMTSAVARA